MYNSSFLFHFSTTVEISRISGYAQAIKRGGGGGPERERERERGRKGIKRKTLQRKTQSCGQLAHTEIRNGWCNSDVVMATLAAPTQPDARCLRARCTRRQRVFHPHPLKQTQLQPVPAAKMRILCIVEDLPSHLCVLQGKRRCGEHFS